MGRIKIRQKEDILALEHTELEEQRIYSLFLQNPNSTIYVTDLGKVTGIVTLGNFRRNRQKKLPLVNHNFISVGIGEKARAYEILNEKTTIHSVPVLDNNNHLIQEYYKEPPEEKVDFGFVCQLAAEFAILSYGYDKIVLVVPLMSAAEKEFAENFYKESERRINITDYLGAEEIKALSGEKSFVYDFCEETYRVRETYYKIWNIANKRVDGYLSGSSWKTMLHDRANLYQKIAVLYEETDFWNDVLDKEIEHASIIGRHCVWNEEEKCYEYQCEAEEGIEALFLAGHFEQSNHILVNGREVCCVSLLQEHNDLDIIKNIIPVFEKHHVRYLIFENPDKEIGEVEDRITVSLRRTGLPTCNFYGVSEEMYQEFSDELDSAVPFLLKNGYLQVADYKGKFVNYLNNERLTANNPSQIVHTIHLFGPCMVSGRYVADSDTVASKLREKIGQNYYIRSYGGGGFTDMNYRVRDHKYRTGDIVLLFVHDAAIYKKYGVKVYSIIDAYKRVEKLDDYVWDCLLHCNYEITHHIADVVYNLLVKKHLLDEQIAGECRPLCFGQKNEGIALTDDLMEWITKASAYKKAGCQNAGAIVMNCNPFTKGHRYLIEQAQEQVDVLYLFVVEEDKSFFKFEDRIHMVRLGTYDLENVVVIPSGKYIISTATLPGYFAKEDNQNVELDATQDLELFARYIAKEFDIRIRFAGEEPIDLFTRQYNQEMRRILPDFGIEFKEIPRVKVDEEAISASRVRKCMSEGDYFTVRKLVLPRVYEYLQKHYFME